MSARAAITVRGLRVETTAGDGVVEGVDFEVAQASQVYDPRWLERERLGEVTREELRAWAGERWNVVKELHVTLRAKKPFDR